MSKTMKFILTSLIFLFGSHFAVAQDSSPIVMSEETFFQNLPKEPRQLAEYIVKLLNKGEQTARGKGRVFKIKYSTDASSSNFIDYKPHFKANHLQVDFYLDTKMANNPLYILEFFSALSKFADPWLITLTGTEQVKVTTPQMILKDGVWMLDQDVKPGSIQETEFERGVWESLGLNFKRDPNPISQAEIKINFDNGSRYAAEAFRNLELEKSRSAHENFVGAKFLTPLSPEVLQGHIHELANKKSVVLPPSDSVETLSKVYYQVIEKKAERDYEVALHEAKEQYRKDFKYLESPEVKEAKNKAEKMSLKLEDYVKANDRESVAKLLETFLPLAIMEPLERSMWKNWIDSIRNPDRENAELVFRGLDFENDKPQVAVDKNKNVSGYGFFSTLLSRNQGNYTRRLRSFTGMRYKFMGNAEGRKPWENAPTLSSLMSNHAASPAGSPMLSFTTDLGVATAFGDRGVIAVAMDKRRLVPNFTTPFGFEMELLVPLIIFPDEILHAEFHDKTQGTDVDKFTAELNAKLGMPYEHFIEEDPRKMFSGAHEIFSSAQKSVIGSCNKIFSN